MNKHQNYYSKNELAAELRVSLRTIDNWLSSGTIGYSKIGRRVIFSKEDIDELMQRNKQEAIAGLENGGVMR